MGSGEISGRDVGQFFRAFGVRQTVDLSRRLDAGWQLRKTVDEVAARLVDSNGGDNVIALDELKDRPIRVRVFQNIASQNEEWDDNYLLEPYEIALALHKAGLVRVPRGKDVPTLWRDVDSVKWGVVEERNFGELNRYLEANTTDEARRQALVTLEGRVAKEGSLLDGTDFLEKTITAILKSSDVEIRGRFLRLFQIDTTPFPVGGTDHFRQSFKPVMDRLRSDDLAAVRHIVQSDNPGQVAFGLLCAEKIMTAEQFQQALHGVAARQVLAGQQIYTYEIYAEFGCGAPWKVTVTLADFVKTLLEEISKTPRG